MITGLVNADLEAVIRLKIRGASGQEEDIEAVIDTGFNGFLTLPLSIISALGCAYLSQGFVILGGGRLEETPIYETIVNWDGQDFSVETDAAESEPLVGMTLMNSYELMVHAEIGGLVSLRKI